MFSHLRQTLEGSYCSSKPRVLLLAAHPDDEVIGAASVIRRVPELEIVHSTTGSPANLQDAFRSGCNERQDYSALRFKELASALQAAGAPMPRSTRLEFPDQECAFGLVRLTLVLHRLLQDREPEVVITHPYEGGHPDHDSTAFALHSAVALLPEGSRPLLVEMTSYHLGVSGIRTGAFLGPCNRDEMFTLEFSREESECKQAMLNCFRSQQATLQFFDCTSESFRVAPDYDFSVPPHAGPLFYEYFNWGVRGELWRALASEARTAWTRHAFSAPSLRKPELCE